MRWWNSRTAGVIQFLGLVGVAVLASGDVDRTMRANDKPVTAEQTRGLAGDVELAKLFPK
jgi:hypothetical protein